VPRPRADRGSARDELLLVAGVDRAGASVLVIILAVLLLTVVTWAATQLRELPGSTGPKAVASATVVATSLVWVVIRRVERLVARRTSRRRPQPAMRLSDTGLDYSPAFTGTFPVHLDWASVRACRHLRGPGGERYWCVFALAIQGLGPLPSTLERRSIVGPDRCRAAAVGQAQVAAALGFPAEDVDLLTHLLAFGTPIAINLAQVDSVSLRDVDARLRRWTDGRCSVRRLGRLPRSG
jgi:hypothetical protein